MRGKIPFFISGGHKSYKKAPDGAFTLEYPAAKYSDNRVKPVGFFLEVDRGTESNAVWGEKVSYFKWLKTSVSGSASSCYWTVSTKTHKMPTGNCAFLWQY